MQTGNTDSIYRNELDRACFQHYMAYGKSKDLTKRTQSDKVLTGKAFKTASGPKYDGYQRGLASMLYKFFDKKSSGSGIATEPNYQLANELHRQIIRKLNRWKVYSWLRENIWGVDLADMQSLRKYNKGIKYLLWVYQGSEFYEKLLKKFLEINNIEISSTNNEGKSLVAERFIRTLKNKIFKTITAVSKNFFYVLDNTVDKCNNTVHRRIKMKPTDITSDSYADYNEDSNETKPKFKIGDHEKIAGSFYEKELQNN